MRKKIEFAVIAGAIIIGGGILICLQAIRTLIEDLDYKRGFFKDWRMK